MERVLLMLVLAGRLFGAVDGQWTVHSPGTPIEILLELKSDGNRLTGAMSGPNGTFELLQGRIDSGNVSFEIATHRRDKTTTFRYTGRLNRDSLELTVRSDDFSGEEHWTATRREAGKPKPDWFSEVAAPREVVDWIKAHAIRLASAGPNGSFDDMAPLADGLRDAQVVAMGEATHGTREFQQIKFRMLQFLVEKSGFTVFGIENNWPETLAINDYVLTGKGDGDRLLHNQFIWWQTEDEREMVRWMRTYNQDLAHTRKLKFYGFDMQAPQAAEVNALDYLERVDPEARAKAAGLFRVIGRMPENADYEKAPEEVKRRTEEALGELVQRFDDRKQEYVARSSREQWSFARQNLVIVRQAEVKLGNQNDTGSAARDRFMAENVQWILDHEPAGSRMMVWAHNGHVAGAGRSEVSPPMGPYLRRIYGGRAVLCGFVFEEGGFRAVDMNTRNLTDFTVGAPPAGSLDATLAAAGIPLFALDLRNLPEGTVKTWFNAPHVSRQIGGGYSDSTPGVWLQRIRPAQAFDLLIFVKKTTPIRSI
ncbi:MAG TPA: erythromycin esterase family protein [Bryobacteraceae bacterium]|jgi:erythromycin esterase